MVLRAIVWLILLLVVTLVGRAAEATPPCLAAADAVEHRWALPPDLMGAVSRVESGRLDLETRRLAPWPWTVNANGVGNFFGTRDEAVRFVQGLRVKGVRFIDVGCFQIDLFYHPEAFASLEDAFDPEMNADYAAQFLTSLHAQTGKWDSAIARYHSGLAVEGERYRAKIMTAWHSGGGSFNDATTAVAGRAMPRHAAVDRYVVLMSADARAIQIFRP